LSRELNPFKPEPIPAVTRDQVSYWDCPFISDASRTYYDKHHVHVYLLLLLLNLFAVKVNMSRGRINEGWLKAKPLAGVATIMTICVISAHLHGLTHDGFPGSCPSPRDLQSDYVKQYFEASKMQGLWYELAYKDVTQPRTCTCQTSEKRIDSNDSTQLNDAFRIECAGNVYFANLTHTFTNIPGVMTATWNLPLMDRIDFPNTVVDVGINNATGEYDWMVEFQCIQSRLFGSIVFHAFNFYSKEYFAEDEKCLEEERLKVMEMAARKQGLAPFFDSGLPIKVVNHSDCIHGHNK
jgi:hypothetical protein